MVTNLAIIREIFKGDHNAAAAARKLRQNQISALSGTINNTLLLYVVLAERQMMSRCT